MSNVYIAEFLLTGGDKTSETDLLHKYEATYLDAVFEKQKNAMSQNPLMMKLYEDIEMPVSKIVQDMHEYGIHINKEKLENLKTNYEARREILIQKITEQLGPINLNSPRQLGQVLVLEHKLNLPKTKTGQFTTSSEALQPYSESQKVVKEILEFRAIDKVINTYITPILDRVDKDNRIHPKYDLMSAATGRLAASDPNIQSTPAGGEYGDAIRQTFTAPIGSKLIAFDYSQQELRILAHLSKDEKLQEAFKKGIDVHVLTAANVLRMSEDKITKYERAIGKTLNFGIVYGETSYGLARQLGKSPEECVGILRRYFETYSGVKKYFDNLMIHAKLHGYIETILGRRRGIPGQKIYTPKKTLIPAEERIIKNFPIQGSAADMTKKAMVDINEEILPKYPEAHLVMQIHDELVFEYKVINEENNKHDKNVIPIQLIQSSSNRLEKDPEKETAINEATRDFSAPAQESERGVEMTKIETFVKEVKEVMEKAIPLTVPVVVDAKVGENWGEI
ncbi:MAG: DNA polymerase [Patescibacteria group bacterium]